MADHRTQKPVLQALAGHPSSPVPAWLMRQAGRYLPEYRELRARAGDFLTLCFTPDLATEITLQPIRRFGFDAAILFSDILVIPKALGQKLWFAEGEGPKLDPLTPSMIATFKPASANTALQPIFQTVANVRAKLSPQTTLLGFAGAPWTVASYMIAGGSSDESIDIRRFAYTNPEDLDALFEVLVEATTAYLIAQLEAGADALQIFESWAATIPASQVDKFSIDPIRRIIDGVRRHAPSVPVIVFPRGAGSAYPRYAAQTGATALSVDTQTSLAWLRRQVGPSMALQGNLDPLALIAGGEPLRQAVAGFHRETAGTPQIFNLGHGIRPETPIAHVEQLLKLLREPA